MVSGANLRLVLILPARTTTREAAEGLTEVAVAEGAALATPTVEATKATTRATARYVSFIAFILYLFPSPLLFLRNCFKTTEGGRFA